MKKKAKAPRGVDVRDRVREATFTAENEQDEKRLADVYWRGFGEPMTACERAVVEAAMLFVARHTEGRKCSIALDPDNCGSSEQIINACHALRAERGGR